MTPFLLSLLSAFFIAFLSVIGIVFLAVKEKKLKRFLILFVSFSAGALLGSAFFHLLPEAIEEFGEPIKLFQYTIIGICLFFILEKVLRWHHCHEIDCKPHQHIGSLNLIGDSVHNLIDGIIIFSAFTVSPLLGLIVTASIGLHEIPQEIGDFGVLLYSGFKKSKALLYNFLAASTVIPGVIIGHFLANSIQGLNKFLLPFAAGGFIYIATSDLIPELHKETNLKKSLASFLVFIAALILMLLAVH